MAASAPLAWSLIHNLGQLEPHIDDIPSRRALRSSRVSFSWTKATSQPDHPKLNTLAGLPSELLFIIADCLSPNDLLCFTLCNRRLFILVLYPIPVLLVRGRKRQSISLEPTRKRDLPAHILCHVCHSLLKHDGSDCCGHFHATEPFECRKRRNCTSQLELRV